MYADNTLIYLSGNEIEDLFERINADLLKLNEWFKANILTLDFDKTLCMVFFRAKIKPDKLKLNWLLHISHVKNKLTKCVEIFFKARPFLSKYNVY